MLHEPSHPSLLELDRFALGTPRSQTTHEHIAQCAQCQRYLESLRQPEALPPWLTHVEATAEKKRRPVVARRLAWAAAPVALGVVVFVSVLSVHRFGGQHTPDTYTAIKGGPAVGLYIRRNQTVFLWDGKQPLRPGDRIRLKVVAPHHRHVNVFTKMSPQTGSAPPWLRLYAGHMPSKRDGLLPIAWRVDNQLGDETLVVVLSNGPVKLPELSALLQKKNTNGDFWVRVYRIQKRAR